jgi:hypothetical protein
MPEPADAVPSDSLAVIAIVYSMPEAMVLVATLNAYGIFALGRNRWHISIQPPLMVALGGIWVAVPRHQEEDALALLYEIDTGWRRPPPALARNEWLNAALSIALTFLCLIPPMPRVRGVYGWRRREWDSPTLSAPEA